MSITKDIIKKINDINIIKEIINNNDITITNALLLENGNFLLLEDGSYILMEG